MATDMNKHVWEGWTVGDFITDLTPQIRMIMNGESRHNRSKANRNSRLGAGITSHTTKSGFPK